MTTRTPAALLYQAGRAVNAGITRVIYSFNHLCCRLDVMMDGPGWAVINRGQKRWNVEEEP